VEQDDHVDPASYGASLTTIRRRRWFVWTTMLLYLPGTAIILELTDSWGTIGIFFSIWAVLLIVAVSLLAGAKCPRCGNSFHMANSTLSFFARCRHCGLHVGGNEG
jgi:uncharacterized membrane protein YdjX (TVP38/TMEM64 family)